jgi:hypothetical protein
MQQVRPSIANYPVRDILFHFPRSPAARGNAPASSKASRILPAIYSLLHTGPLTISRQRQVAMHRGYAAHLNPK